jgi:hypothetical protein
MQHCDQVGIADAAFVHLKGIHTLNMWGSYHAGITPALRDRLRGTCRLVFM